MGQLDPFQEWPMGQVFCKHFFDCNSHCLNDLKIPAKEDETPEEKKERHLNHEKQKKAETKVKTEGREEMAKRLWPKTEQWEEYLRKTGRTDVKG